MLRIEGLSKVFLDPVRGKGLVALKDIDLVVQDGEFICLIGPSGCGKTTLLSIIAGFEPPTRGRVTVDGDEIIGPGVDRGVVFQEDSLFPWMSVSSNVEFALRSRTKDAGKRKARAAEALKAVGLSDFAASRPNELSGGMKQRVAIARVLAMDPGMMLMDEPFGSLDEQTRKKLDNDVVDIWLKKGKTIIFITHNLDEAICLGSRVVLFSHAPGTVMKEWRLDMDRPRDPDSREFVELREEIRRMMPTCNCAGRGEGLRPIDIGGLEK